MTSEVHSLSHCASCRDRNEASVLPIRDQTCDVEQWRKRRRTQLRAVRVDYVDLAVDLVGSAMSQSPIYPAASPGDGTERGDVLLRLVKVSPLAACVICGGVRTLFDMAPSLAHLETHHKHTNR